MGQLQSHFTWKLTVLLSNTKTVLGLASCQVHSRLYSFTCVDAEMNVWLPLYHGTSSSDFTDP